MDYPEEATAALLAGAMAAGNMGADWGAAAAADAVAVAVALPPPHDVMVAADDAYAAASK
ncbi:MAG: hypothetical protein FRX49_08817 [Trebouxia sp. A1-2]|nr:MAG: hypothetical protein FRX49_08817 [Trebouxia sp. A1-2]